MASLKRTIGGQWISKIRGNLFLKKGLLKLPFFDFLLQDELFVFHHVYFTLYTLKFSQRSQYIISVDGRNCIKKKIRSDVTLSIFIYLAHCRISAESFGYLNTLSLDSVEIELQD